MIYHMIRFSYWIISSMTLTLRNQRAQVRVRFEILTYSLPDSTVNFIHEDSEGGHGTVRPGAIQWLRCGRGLMHHERWVLHYFYTDTDTTLFPTVYSQCTMYAYII